MNEKKRQKKNWRNQENVKKQARKCVSMRCKRQLDRETDVASVTLECETQVTLARLYILVIYRILSARWESWGCRRNSKSVRSSRLYTSSYLHIYNIWSECRGSSQMNVAPPQPHTRDIYGSSLIQYELQPSLIFSRSHLKSSQSSCVLLKSVTMTSYWGTHVFIFRYTYKWLSVYFSICPDFLVLLINGDNLSRKWCSSVFYI